MSQVKGQLFLNHGFTIFEVLLTVAAMAIVAGMGVPIYQSFQVRNDLDIAGTTVAQSFRRAQILAQSQEGDISWGVNVEAGSITLFKGASFASRDTNFDEVFGLPNSITPSGLDEVVFEKFTGLPQSTGTVTLTSSTEEIRNITINEKGTIGY